MEFDQSYALNIAQKHIGTTHPLRRLGWGISGFVFESPDGRTAVKVHKHLEGYDTEVKAYQLLRRLKMTKMHGLTIPKLRSYRDDYRAIQMDFVAPPFLLDFAGVVFSPPDFTKEVWDHWHKQIQFRIREL